MKNLTEKQNELTFTVKVTEKISVENCPLCGTEFTPDVLWVYLDGKEAICSRCIERCTSFGSVTIESEPEPVEPDGNCPF